MSNMYSVDYANKTVRQLPDMEKPKWSRDYFSRRSDDWEDVNLAWNEYEIAASKMPTYPCPTMPESWRERETVELDKDFKIRQQWNADTRQIAIPIAEVKNKKPDVDEWTKKEWVEFIKWYVGVSDRSIEDAIKSFKNISQS